MQGIVTQVSRSDGGVPKLAVAGPVSIGLAGVQGDRQRDLRHHGGPFRAILMIAAGVLEDLAKQGFTVYPGALGENLTVAGLNPADWRRGQRYRIGADLVIELTTLREPCSNLFPYGRYIGEQLYDARCRAGDTSSPNWARGGFYASVVEGGMVGTGAPVRLEENLA